MNDKTKTALLASIKKWDDIAERDGANGGSEDCALCELYLDLQCEGCPVYKQTMETNCSNSPYVDFAVHRHLYHGDTFGPAECDECRRLARAEREFLTALLQEEPNG